jgi:hypothetical protein
METREQRLERQVADLRGKHEALLRVIANFAAAARLAVEEGSYEAEYDALFDLRSRTLHLLEAAA